MKNAEPWFVNNQFVTKAPQFEFLAGALALMLIFCLSADIMNAKNIESGHRVMKHIFIGVRVRSSFDMLILYLRFIFMYSFIQKALQCDSRWQPLPTTLRHVKRKLGSELK